MLPKIEVHAGVWISCYGMHVWMRRNEVELIRTWHLSWRSSPRWSVDVETLESRQKQRRAIVWNTERALIGKAGRKKERKNFAAATFDNLQNSISSPREKCFVNEAGEANDDAAN